MEKVAAFVVVSVLAAWGVSARCRRHKWKPLEYSVLFGVVGGLGPRATSVFVDDVIQQRIALFHAMQKGGLDAVSSLPYASPQWTRQEVESVLLQSMRNDKQQLLDQDHIPLLIAQATTTPPRPKYILNQSVVNPLFHLTQVARMLIQAGCTHLVVICNTAHYFWSEVEQQCPGHVVFLNMISLTLHYIDVKFHSNKRVGVFATSATLQTNLYNDERFEFFSPLPPNQTRIEEVIFGKHGIKTGFDTIDTKEGWANLKALLMEAIEMKTRFGVRVIILACSELPLILHSTAVHRFLEGELEMKKELEDMIFLDPSRILVHEVLRLGLLSRT